MSPTAIQHHKASIPAGCSALDSLWLPLLRQSVDPLSCSFERRWLQPLHHLLLPYSVRDGSVGKLLVDAFLVFGQVIPAVPTSVYATLHLFTERQFSFQAPELCAESFCRVIWLLLLTGFSHCLSFLTVAPGLPVPCEIS